MQRLIPDTPTGNTSAPSELDAAVTRSFCLLRDDIISIRYQDETHLASLPEAYAELATDRVDDFPGVRPHQRHFWHAGLCQVGAIAMVNAGIEDPPSDPEEWLRIIRHLTKEDFPDDEPWHLAVDDITKPAFLQPSASSAEKAADYKRIILTPDEMDLPVGSKHHDVRDRNMRNATPEQWLFALVARQTAGGYDGPRLYGASRMNSGYGNRHGFSLTPSTRWGRHVSRDLRVLARQHRGQNVKSLLLWTRPWDGSKPEPIPLHELEPLALYVEAARRVRLAADAHDNLKGQYATSQTRRIHAEEAKGLTQDPWAITEAEKSVTVTGEGFNYRQTSRYLDPEKYALPPLAKLVSAVDGNNQMHLVARAIVRGQGKTEGYYERTIPLGRSAARMLGSTSEQKRLHRMAEDRVNIIREVQSILGHAVKTYLQDGVSNGKTKAEHQKVITETRRRLDQTVDLEFWQHLQEELDNPEPQQARAGWCHGTLVPQARKILDNVVQSRLCHRKEQYKATVEALDLFGRRIRSSPKLPTLPEEAE